VDNTLSINENLQHNLAFNLVQAEPLFPRTWFWFPYVNMHFLHSHCTLCFFKHSYCHWRFE
jgi:hypothetical protein